MDFKALKKVHVIGAGGIGVSAAAKYLLHLGVKLTASDRERSTVTDLLEKKGVTVMIGQKSENVPSDAELILFSSAVPESNPERARAKELGIKEMTYNQFLGELSKNYRTIAVSGTHGKSTTTAMLGKILEAAGLDPLVIVGSLVPGFEDGNLRMGKGEWFVVEACEHMRHFLELNPEILVVTNIEEDHLDYYRDLNDIKSAFAELASRPKQIIWCADDQASREVLIGKTGKSVSVKKSDSSVLISASEVKDGVKNWKLGEHSLSLPLPGAHNVLDASLAALAAELAGANWEAISRSLSGYNGIWRRFEKAGELDGTPIYSDYAHHPSEIRATLQAARELYPDRRLVVAFKPHQHNRTKMLWSEFVQAFELANLVVLAEIYDVAGREEQKDQDVNSRKLVDDIRAHNEAQKIHQTVVYQKTNADVAEFLLESVRPLAPGRPADVVFVMGAGDIDEVARKIVN